MANNSNDENDYLVKGKNQSNQRKAVKSNGTGMSGGKQPRTLHASTPLVAAEKYTPFKPIYMPKKQPLPSSSEAEKYGKGGLVGTHDGSSAALARGGSPFSSASIIRGKK